MATSGGDMSWYFSQVKGALYDEAQEGIDFDTLALIPIILIFI